MKKDIHIPEVKNVAVAIVREEAGPEESVWQAYILNLGKEKLHNVLISSTGYGKIGAEQRKTTTLRHYIGDINPEGFAKIEPVIQEVLGLNNEYWVSFYIDKQIFDKRYVFLAESIREEHLIKIPLLGMAGVMIK